MPIIPTARRLSRRTAAGVCLSATVLAMTACGGSSPHSESSQPAIASHDSAWIDSAIALVGTESGHDPVVKVAIDAAGAMITTRHADSRVQRQWWVALDPHAILAASPTPHATVTPTPLPTPSATSATPSATSSASRARSASPSAFSTSTPPTRTSTPDASSTASSSAYGPGTRTPGGGRSATGTPRTGRSASASATPSGASATPVFSVPSYAPATPTVPDKVDNSLGNMGLGAFGDTQVLPMWNRLVRLGCHSDNWTITATASWSGEVLARGACDGQSLVQANGNRLPHNRNPERNAAVEGIMLQNLVPNDVARVVIRRVPVQTCPTTLTADYVVGLGGPLHLRTTITCTDITTVVLSNGWLPPNRVPTTSIALVGIRGVDKDLAAHYRSLLGAPLRVEWSDLYGQAVYSPATSANGRPAYAANGTPLK